MTIRIPDYLCLLSVFILVLLIYGNMDCAICPCLSPTGTSAVAGVGVSDDVTGGGSPPEKTFDSI